MNMEQNPNKLENLRLLDMLKIFDSKCIESGFYCKHHRGGVVIRIVRD